MNYHDIRKFDMINGEGCRVVLFVSGCDHHCKGCQNPETWDPNSGIPFDEKAMFELLSDLDKPYIEGLTLSGGDPLNKNNLKSVLNIVKTVKEKLPNKNIWLYTGYTFDELQDTSDPENKIRREILGFCDVLVDGKFEEDKKDNNYPWAGSTNQKIIKLI